MLTLKYTRQSRALLGPPSTAANASTVFVLLSSPAAQSYPFSSDSFSLSSWHNPMAGSQSEIPRDDVVSYYREWFMSRKKPLFDRIFEILRTEDESSVDLALSRFNLHLSEVLIIDALKYGKKDVHSCLKFFDWAGRQPGFHHTRVTFNAIFRILSKAKWMKIFDFLPDLVKQKYGYRAQYYTILVIGYAVAGKSLTALKLFGRMRFAGVDLDSLAYHVLLNSLVEQGYFDMVDMVSKEIRLRGFQHGVTHSIMMKSFCKQNELERGEEYLRGVAQDDGAQLSGIAVGTFVEALCKDNQFERASLLVEEFRRMGLGSMEHAYGVWIRNLVKAGELDGALEFLKDKQVIEGYVPDVFRYNLLICKLLRENRMEEVYDLMVDMKEREILPDDITMNAILCFLCKAGRMDIVMDLYDSREEFGLSVNSMAYNYLINALLGDVIVDEAYRVLRNSINQGYLPGQKTFSIIADALCREGRIDKLKELVRFTLDKNVMPNSFYDKVISTLCRNKRVADGYNMHGLLNSLNKSARKSSYVDLISGFSKSHKGDIAARLLIEMEENGHMPSRKLIREVISCLCETSNPENQFFLGLLEMLLVHRHSSSSSSVIFNHFISGAGHAKRPKLAFELYKMMRRNGIEPNTQSDILLLQSFLRSGKISHALHLFYLPTSRRTRKLWHAMVVSLCKAGQPNMASEILNNMKANELRPSIECYEELIKAYCDLGEYYKAIELVSDMTQMGRPISSFIGNVFLLHALKYKEVYYDWDFLSRRQHLTLACRILGQAIDVFSPKRLKQKNELIDAVEGNQNDVDEEELVNDVDEEELVQLIQQCFHIDMYTNNMLLRRLCMNGMDRACTFFNRVHEKGYEPNRWTYDIIIHGLIKEGRIEEARIWMDEMFSKRFHLTKATRYKVINA